MRHIVQILYLLLPFSCVAEHSLAGVGNGGLDEYRLVWEDRFDGTALDTAIWNIEINGEGGGNQELQYYRAENVGIGIEPTSKRSCLILTARREEYLGKKATSGRVYTKGCAHFTYGKIEASIKTPHTANGIWPAFWMLGADIDHHPWPKSGEIDIMEMGHLDGIKNGTQNRYFNGACHWGEYDENGNYPNYANSITNPYPLQDDFHLFTLVWDTEEIQMFLDMDKHPNEAPYFTMKISDFTEPNASGYFFHKPHFILFNLAVGGNFTGIWAIDQVTGFVNNEAKMYVDYVRVYQKR